MKEDSGGPQTLVPGLPQWANPPPTASSAPCYSMPGSKRLPGEEWSRKHPSRRAPSDHMHLSGEGRPHPGPGACSGQLGGGASTPPKLNPEPQGL